MKKKGQNVWVRKSEGEGGLKEGGREEKRGMEEKGRRKRAVRGDKEIHKERIGMRMGHEQGGGKH